MSLRLMTNSLTFFAAATQTEPHTWAPTCRLPAHTVNINSSPVTWGLWLEHWKRFCTGCAEDMRLCGSVAITFSLCYPWIFFICVLYYYCSVSTLWATFFFIFCIWRPCSCFCLYALLENHANHIELPGVWNVFRKHSCLSLPIVVNLIGYFKWVRRQAGLTDKAGH